MLGQLGNKTPSSILKRRANKENGKDAKRGRLRGRRVSFAPDEELHTMHLYDEDTIGGVYRGGRGGYGGDGDDNGEDMQITEDLAARMPHNQLGASAAGRQGAYDENGMHHAAGSSMGAGQWGQQAGGSYNHQMSAAIVYGDNQENLPGLHIEDFAANMGAPPISPGPNNLMSPLSMDLTNNSVDIHHQQGLSKGGGERQGLLKPGAPQQQHSTLAIAAAVPLPGMPGGGITCSIPALSTLVEEDEEAGLDGGDSHTSLPDGHRAASVGAEYRHNMTPVADDHTAGMELTGNHTESLAGAAGTSAAAGINPGAAGNVLGIAAEVALPESPVPYAYGGGLMGMGQRPLTQQELDLVVSPATPFMPRGENSSGEGEGGNPGVQLGGGRADDTDDLKGKWGFTPGADDTLDVGSKGRLVMGDTTYNHVYGSTTTGDITRAMQATASAASAAAPAAVPTRSAIAAAANAAMGVPAAPAAGGFSAALNRLSMAGGSGGAGAGAGYQSEMTINLLADDEQMDVWGTSRGGGGAGPVGRGSQVPRTSVASSLPLPVAPPAAPAPAALAHPTAALDATYQLLSSSTTALLGGGQSHNNSRMNNASSSNGTTALLGGMTGAAVMAAGPGAGGALGSRTANNTTAGAYTLQLLAENTAIRAPLAPGGSGAAPALAAQAKQAAGGGGKDMDVSGALSSAFAASAHVQDLTAVSMDFSLGAPAGAAAAVPAAAGSGLVSVHSGNISEGFPGAASGGGAGIQGSGSMPSSFLGDGNLTLDDFSKPPELQNNTSNTNSGQINSSSQGAGAGLLAASQSQHHSQPMSISHSHSQPMSSYPGLTLPSQQHLASQEMMGTQSQLLTQEEPVTAAAHHLHQLSSQQQAYPHAPQFQGAHAINNSQQSWVPSSQGGLPSQQQAAPQRAVPPITFQEFLGLVEVRFLDDMRRRTSLLQQAPYAGMDNTDHGPAPVMSLADALDTLYVSGVRTAGQKASIEELAEKVEALQSRISAGEAALARDNPPIFKAIQLAGPEEAEAIRDQVKVLKRACRHRTMLAWKQARIEQEQTQAAGLREAAATLEQAAHDAQHALETALGLEAAVNRVHSDVVQQVTQDVTDFQAAQAAREREAAAAQRLEEVRHANAARTDRLREAGEAQEAARARYEEVLQQKAALQRSLQAAKGAGVTSATPPTGGPASAKAAVRRPETPSAKRLAKEQGKLEALMGVQGIQLDARSLPSDGSWSLLLFNRWVVRVTPATSTTAQGGGGVQQAGSDSESKGALDVAVSLHTPGFQTSQLARALLPLIESATCRTHTSVPPAKLRALIDQLLRDLGHTGHAVSQLEAALLQWPALTRITTAGSSSTQQASTEAAGPCNQQGSTPAAALTLWFATAQAQGARMSVTLGAPSHMSLLTLTPSCKPEVVAVSVSHPEDRVSELTAQALAVLRDIPASHAYLHDLCSVASRLVVEAAGCGAQDVSLAAERTVLSNTAAAVTSSMTSTGSTSHLATGRGGSHWGSGSASEAAGGVMGPLAAVTPSVTPYGSQVTPLRMVVNNPLFA